ncbi:MAG: ABC transporter ATP-binding protein, partial [Chloroflexi bacterium]|nr:ABC transporter ATP-binding protein [Chloroflexota bacterium]
ILNRGRVVVQGRVEELLGAHDLLEIRIDRPEDAERVLAALPWVTGVTRDGDHLLVSAPAARAAEVTRALADQGLYLAGLRPREMSLEQYFLDVTAEEAA